MFSPEMKKGSVVKVLLLVGMVGAVGAAGGFTIGVRWPIETIEEWFAGPPSEMGWSDLTESDLPRYEMVKTRIGEDLILMGGFFGEDTEATSRIERLGLTVEDLLQAGRA